MNWLDVCFALIIGASVFSGFRKGMIRIGIGFVASIVAFVLASWFYGTAASFLTPTIGNRTLASFAGFILVFSAVMLLGALVSFVVARMFKLVGLSWLDRLAGGAFGVVRGVLISVVLLLIMLAFPIARMRAAVAGSTIAPYVIDTSHFISAITPFEIKDGFRASYEQVKKLWAETLKSKHKRKLPEDRT